MDKVKWKHIYAYFAQDVFVIGVRNEQGKIIGEWLPRSQEKPRGEYIQRDRQYFKLKYMKYKPATGDFAMTPLYALLVLPNFDEACDVFAERLDRLGL